MLYIYSFENYLKVGGLVYPNRPFKSVPYNLHAKDLFYLP